MVLPPEAHDSPTPPRNVVAWPGAVRGGRPVPSAPRRRPRPRRGFPLRLLVLAAVPFAVLALVALGNMAATAVAAQAQLAASGVAARVVVVSCVRPAPTHDLVQEERIASRLLVEPIRERADHVLA